MENTRFMTRLFSAVENNEEELAGQVAKDIEDAKANGVVDTDEVKYESEDGNKVVITDKETGEVTIAEKAGDEDEMYDLYPAESLEGYLHPEGDGVTPGEQVGEVMEDVSEDHLAGEEISTPEVTWDEAYGERKFSVTSDNSVVLKIFSDQAFCERLFSEVIESSETAVVGDLKVEKDPEDEASVVVTSKSTGDQAKVTLDGEEMEVTELESKNFGEDCEEGCGEYMPLFVVGIDPTNNVLVDAPVYEEENATDLVNKLATQGVEAIQVFDNMDAAREYAFQLISGLGVNVEDPEAIEEPEQVEFSNHGVYLTKFYSDNTSFMTKLFSEAMNDIDATQSIVEDAIAEGDEVETKSEIITPIDEKTAIVEDKESGEFTKVMLDGEEMNLLAITGDEVDELIGDDEDSEEEEKEFSDIYCNEAETRFFSENESMTSYMVRLYSEEADQEDIEEAIEKGEQIETEKEVITPVDEKTAIVEDKESGEFTKAIIDEEVLDVTPISEEEADELTKDIEVESEEEEKEFSDIYCNEAETRFFSENESMTSYMVRLYSEEADQEDIEKAIESGEEVETETEVIKPISEDTAIIEDKESGEFTKAVVEGEGIEVTPLTEEEAEELGEEDEKVEEKEEEKSYSTLDKFFSDIQKPEEVVEEEVVEEKPTVEAIEDKALAAIQNIREVADEAEQAIEEAKAAPVAQDEEDLKEAQFSEKIGEQLGGTLVSWMAAHSVRK